MSDLGNNLEEATAYFGKWARMKVSGVPVNAIVQQIRLIERNDKLADEFELWANGQRFQDNKKTETDFGEWARMMEIGVPVSAIVQQIRLIEKNDKLAEEFALWAEGKSFEKHQDEAAFDSYKYETLKRRGVPLDAVKALMTRDGCSEAHIEAFSAWAESGADAPPPSDIRAPLSSPGNTDPLPMLEKLQVADLDILLKEHGTSRNVVQFLKLRDGVDIPAMFQLDQYIANEFPPSQPPEQTALEHDDCCLKGVVQAALLDPYLTSDDTKFESVAGFIKLISTDVSQDEKKLLQIFLTLLRILGNPDTPVVEKARLLGGTFAGLQDRVFVPFGYNCNGQDLMGFSVLIVERNKEDPSFYTVSLCNKHQIAYHPQKLDENGHLRVCPILTLQRVPRLRLLDPTFLLMATRLFATTSKWNLSRVVYEVLFPFLAGGAPLHAVCSDLYSGVNVPFWTKAGRSRGGFIAPLLVGLRYVRSAPETEWFLFKLRLRVRAAECMLEMEGDFDAQTIKAAAGQLARASLKPKVSNYDKKSNRNLIARLVLMAKQLARRERLHSLEMKSSATLLFREFDISSVFSFLSKSAHYEETAKLVLRRTRCESLTVGQEESAQHWLNLVNPEANNLTLALTSLASFCAAYTGQPHVVISSVTSAIGTHLPMDLVVWEQSNEWESPNSQQRAIAALLEIARLFMVANQSDRDSCLVGDRVVSMACMFAWANVIIQAGSDRGCVFSRYLAGMNTTVHPCGNLLNGLDFSEATSVLEMTCPMSKARATVAPLFRSKGVGDELLWDYSMIGTNRTKPEFTLRVAGDLATDSADVDLTASTCASAFGSSMASAPEFATLRDLAVLYKLSASPHFFSSPSSHSVDFAIEYKLDVRQEEIATHILVDGEDVFHDMEIVKKRYRSKAQPANYLSGRAILTSKVDEEAVLYSDELPMFDGYVSEEESERLLSFLSVPHIRIPACLSFFAERSSYLFNEELFSILQAVLLEPGALQPRDYKLPELGSIPIPVSNLPSSVSLLQDELSQGDFVIRSFIQILENVLKTCQKAVQVPTNMLKGLERLAVLGSIMEGYSLNAQLGKVLRGPVLELMEKHSQFAGCVAVHLHATDTQEAFDDILLWATQCPVKDQRIHRVLTAHSEVGLRAQHCDSTITEIVSLSRPLPQNTKWDRVGFGFVNGGLMFDMLSAIVVVHGMGEQKAIPLAIQNMDSALLGTSTKRKCLRVDLKYLPEGVETSIELCNNQCDLLQISVHKTPLLKPLPLTEVTPPQTSTVFGGYDVAVSPKKTAVMVNARHRGLIVSSSECTELYGVYDNDVLLPLFSSEPSCSSFGEIEEEDQRQQYNISAVLLNHETLRAMYYVPRWLISAYVPCGLLQEQVFFFDNSSNTIRSASSFFGESQAGLGEESTGSSQVVIDMEGRIMSRGLTLQCNPPGELSRAMYRLDDAGFVLFWESSDGGTALIEYPRLRLRFVQDNERMVLEENPELYFDPSIDQERSNAPSLAGLVNYIVLVNDAREEVVVVSHQGKEYSLCRLDPTGTLLQPSSKAQALKLFIAKLEGKAYESASELLSMLSTDQPVDMSVMEKVSLDDHPDAVAVRLALFEATLLRTRQTFPKGTSLLRDCVRYIRCCHGQISPRLRLQPLVLAELARKAITTGRKGLKERRMAATTGGEADFSTDLDITLVTALLEFCSSQTAIKVPRLIPLHGGGGFHRIRACAMQWAEDVLEDPAEWAKLAQIPHWNKELSLSRELSMECIDHLLEKALEANSPDLTLCAFVNLVRDVEHPSGVGLALMELLAFRIYLHRQQLQGTLMFERTSFNLLALICCKMHQKGLPNPSLKCPPALTTTRMIEALHGSELTRKWGVASTFEMSRLKNEPPLLQFDTSHHQYFHVHSDNTTPVPFSNTGPILESSAFFKVLLQENVMRSSTRAEGAIRLSSIDNAAFSELEDNDSVDSFASRTKFVNRVRQGTLAHLRWDPQPKYILRKLDINCIEEALGLADSELENAKNTMLCLMSKIMEKSKAVFDETEITAHLAPTFSLSDMLKLFSSKNSLECLRPLLTELLELCSVFHATLRVHKTLESILLKLEGRNRDIGPDEEVLSESLLQTRNHSDARFSVCEFEAGYLFRPLQVSLVNRLSKEVETTSTCHQLKMGDGKSSTIFPLVALCLANKGCLTVLAVPEPLLEMSAAFLAKVLSGILRTRVFHFEFSRYTLYQEEALRDAQDLLHNLRLAHQSRSIVLTTAVSIKAVLLKLMEVAAEETETASDPLFTVLRDIVSCFRAGKLLLDECDVLLHPLKSELNFPTGQKQVLSHRDWRTKVAKRLIQSLHGEELMPILEVGIAENRLQSSPHLVLVDTEFYEQQMAEPLAVGLAKWLWPVFDSPDACLTKFRGKCKAKADSQRACGHFEIENIFNSKKWYWCSDDLPGTVTVVISLNSAIVFGAIDIQFRQYSSFFSRSGLSMLPSEVVVQTWENGRYKTVCKSGEFVSRRLYREDVGDSVPKATRKIRLVLSGTAAWFAINKVDIFANDSDVGKGLCRFLTRKKTKQQLEENGSRVENLAKALLADDASTRESIALELCKLRPSNMLLVSIASVYLNIVLPHCLGKVNSVSHGLIRDLNFIGEDASASRRYMSVPYLGKDAPSNASEFSHPDVLIMLTLLAYRHGGMRLSDVAQLSQILKADLRSEPRPIHKRKAFLQFEELLEDTSTHEYAVMPLHLFQCDNKEQVSRLWERIRYSGLAIHLFCDLVAFPAALNHHSRKFCATGEDVIMCNSIGMSGTPSSALPLAFGESGCQFEERSEGFFFAVLCDPGIVTVANSMAQGWTSCDVLDQVVTGGYCGLIDSGALITGMSNREVAEYLLKRLTSKQGVVYLHDTSGEKMILVRRRGTTQSLPLSSSALGPGERFAYYDQIHTTGMDLVLPPNAKGCITIGKDMNFRDYAQAAFRMRRLGKGQKLCVVFPSTVDMLVQRTLSREAREVLPVQHQLVVYLFLNGFRQLRSQEDQLLRTQLEAIWRTGALRVIFDGDSKTSKNSVSKAAKVFEKELTFDLEELASVQIPKDQVVSFKMYITTRKQEQDVQRILKLMSTGDGGKKKWKMRALRRIFLGGFASFKLDAEQQQERALDAEQQQEREKEQEVETMGEISSGQPCAWSGRRVESVCWTVQDLEGRDNDSFVDLQMVTLQGGSETKAQRLKYNVDCPVKLSINHTLAAPPNNSRLKNIEVVLVHEENVIVVSLEEAGVLRWICSRYPEEVAFDLRLVDTDARIGSKQSSADVEAGIQLVRFFNISHEFSQSQVKLLTEAVDGCMTPHQLLSFYATSKRHRRRDLAPGVETAKGATLRELFL